jgi:hypothetical protein
MSDKQEVCSFVIIVSHLFERPDHCEQLIDIIETVYRGACKGRGLVVSPKDYSCVVSLASFSLLFDARRTVHDIGIDRLDAPFVLYRYLLQCITMHAHKRVMT